ncbi:MAG: carbohydrate kinase [Ilumatobacteraceae bacterium]|nr:carbohydrate kinase [Ilumatobacteraceae bacterium]
MIVVAGEALVDLVQTPDGAVAAQLGGGPFNVARTIARLVQDVTFLGAISNDRFGQRLFQRLVDDGVDTSATIRTELPTTLASAEVDATGAASYRFYIDGTSAPSLAHVPDGMATPSAVHVGTLGLVLQPMASTLMRYVEAVSPATTIMVDPNCRAAIIDDRLQYLDCLQQVYRCAHIVKISTDDAEYLSPGTDPVDVARELLSHGPRVVLVTAGAEGTTAVWADDQTVVPARPVQVVDTIGAGDSFGGGFLAWWIGNGLGIDELADHRLIVAGVAAAQQVAAFTCQQAGAEPPRRDQLPPQLAGT